MPSISEPNRRAGEYKRDDCDVQLEVKNQASQEAKKRAKHRNQEGDGT